ncbi:hypothetical protein PAXINDRAFT_169318 [Paxillus involutus ATCC 200175]|uniref:HTH CENPB-type domain-containing protein n=1 Tax=Paxillus involutus ATCC 200175 TaxID=664439 RepID=A0A0C9THL7_PAXIN|nr:hypothetical protein PAXINDRAFT_169318 [Paxillus involutus ATCC 200175]
MVGRAKSQASKKRITSTHQEQAIADAIHRYNENKEKPREERKSLRAICREVQEEWRTQKKDNNITVNNCTVTRRLQGGRSCLQANVENHAWLTHDEEESVVGYLLELATRGLPLTHKALKLHVDTLLQARLGNTFPQTGVGRNWTDRFATRHADRVRQYWSSTPIPKGTHDAENVEEDCLWATDETGAQPGGGPKERQVPGDE